MIPDDVYRSRLQATIEELRYWIPSIADWARIEPSEAPASWKLSVEPRTAGAAPFELLLRTDRHYDLSVAGETFEDQPIDTLDLFLPLVSAISDGRIIQRRRLARFTGAPLSVETRIALGDGSVWSRLRTLSAGTAMRPEEIEIRDRHFLPYRR